MKAQHLNNDAFVRSQASRMGIKVVTRRMEDGTFRVWRVS